MFKNLRGLNSRVYLIEGNKFWIKIRKQNVSKKSQWVRISKILVEIKEWEIYWGIKNGGNLKIWIFNET